MLRPLFYVTIEMLLDKNALVLNSILVEIFKKSKSSHKVLAIYFEKMEFASGFSAQRRHCLHVSVRGKNQEIAILPFIQTDLTKS